MSAQLPRMRSAAALSPRPIAIDARAAPPEEANAANAVTSMMTGRHTPIPVSASVPSPGMWPIYTRSTML